MSLDPGALARELAAAYAARRIVPPPTSRDPGFGLESAYTVESELVRMRLAAGAHTAGRKVGFANRALWRKFGLDSVLWAHMYDDTVRYAPGSATLDVSGMVAPKIEPEIIFRLRRPPNAAPTDAAGVLESVEWLALGFEIVDAVYPDWKFQPADFVAAFGLHAALIVGEPLHIAPAMIPALVDQLASVKARLVRDGVLVAEGSGANVLGSPALSLGELAAGITRRQDAAPLGPGEVIATGAMTDNQFIAPGEVWTASVEGLDLPDLTLRITTK